MALLNLALRIYLGRTARPSAFLRRGLATSTVRSHSPMLGSLPASNKPLEDNTSLLGAQMASAGASGGALLASSPLLLTELDPKFQTAEWIFALSGGINGFIEKFFECDGGPAFLNGLVLVTLLRFGMYYGWWQPSYVYHFQERYGQTWTVGHHLNGCDIPNPLKKGK